MDYRGRERTMARWTWCCVASEKTAAPLQQTTATGTTSRSTVDSEEERLAGKEVADVHHLETEAWQ